MDVVSAVKAYVNKMTADPPGMKVLLMDSQTTPIVSAVVSHSYLLAKEVFLVDRIDKQDREKMKHLRCVCFLRPTADSLQRMMEELREPKYGQYHIYFSNILKKSDIQRLAEVDEFEVVRTVHEFYGDYLAIHPDLFSFNLTHPQNPLFGESPSLWDAGTFQRTVEGLVSLLLSLKKRPLIRYEKNSALAKRLAGEVHYQMQQEKQLFDFRRPESTPILLVLDRKNDPVTPLLNQWTYEAMVHELLTINNGRVDMSSAANVTPDMKEIILSSDQDVFYKNNMFLNFGDLGANIKSYVEEYQHKTKSNMKVDTIAEMKRFVEEYPEFKKLAGNVSKHVMLVGELSRMVDRDGLLEVGELEQNLACVEQHATDLKNLQMILEKPNVSADMKVRLVLLYSLRYERSPANSRSQLVDMLHKNGVDERKTRMIDIILGYAGFEQRQEDIFYNESILSKSKNVIRGLQGVENVYTQHKPHLVQTIDAMIKGKLKDALYPFVDGFTREKPQEIIVFFVGGTTYAEARAVATINSTIPGVRVLLGGTTIHNSKSFLKEVEEGSYKWTKSI